MEMSLGSRSEFVTDMSPHTQVINKQVAVMHGGIPRIEGVLCIYVYIYTPTYMYVNMYTYMYTYTHIYIYTYIRVYSYIYMHMSMYIDTLHAHFHVTNLLCHELIHAYVHVYRYITCSFPCHELIMSRT